MFQYLKRVHILHNRESLNKMFQRLDVLLYTTVDCKIHVNIDTQMFACVSLVGTVLAYE